MQLIFKNKSINITVAFFLIFITCFFQYNFCFTANAENSNELYNYVAEEKNGEKISKSLLDFENGAVFENGTKLNDAKILYLPSGSKAILKVNVASSDSYSLYIKYKAEIGLGGNIETEVLIDGKMPLEDSNCLSFPRLYTQGEILKDAKGIDDVQPVVAELDVWQQRYAYDNTGYSNEPYLFDLTKGEHTVTLTALRGGLYIEEIGFTKYEAPVSYDEYSATYKNVSKGTDEALLQGEELDLKTDTTVLPKNVSVSADIYPQSPSEKLLNTIGGSAWKNPRSEVSWKFEIKQDGIYYITAKYIQNFTNGIFSSRKILIDGKSLFKELEAVRFDYSDTWKTVALGNKDSAYGIYLTKGTHILTMESVVGDMSSYIYEIDRLLEELNDIYREIIKITGSSPDIYRDYEFKKLIPKELGRMAEIADELEELSNQIIDIAKVDAGYTSIIEKIVYQIRQMTDKPRNMAKHLVSYKSNLGSLATWVLDSTQQPLQIDWICVSGNPEFTVAEKGFFAKLKHGIIRLLVSFVKDYNSIGVDNEASTEKLVVWTQTGRDQAEVLRHLIETDFCEQEPVSVKLQVVAAGTLLPSLSAGTGPDVVLNNVSSDPINYAIRDAVADLSQMEGYGDVAERFFPASVEPFIFGGKTYALPETFSFPMFFYRKDIFEQYGWKVPDTFDEMKSFTAELQSKDMNMSLPAGLIGYGTVLYQNGGKFYEENGKKTALDTDLALSSFEQYMKWYTLYTLPASYSFVNRFRTGEMPCGIEDYTTYNTLVVFAPEIAGSWEMVPIPGTKREDGTIDRSTVGTSVGTMITEQSDKKELAWSFVKWWLSEDIQSTYGRNLESILGSAAKYNTANKNALKRMTWSYQEYNALTEQASWTKAIPEVPGGYYLSRTITFAFNRSYNSNSESSVGEEPTEVIKDYIFELNSELTRKRREFGLED